VMEKNYRNGEHCWYAKEYFFRLLVNLNYIFAGNVQ